MGYPSVLASTSFMKPPLEACLRDESRPHRNKKRVSFADEVQSPVSSNTHICCGFMMLMIKMSDL